MHWAAHGQTAAEVIYKRVNAEKQNLGLTSFKGANPTKEEIKIAKNYLNNNELELLNRMVSAYLDIAEIHALDQKPMYMHDWIEKLNDFLKLTGKNILQNAGSISHVQAITKAQKEYLKYKEYTKNELSKAEKHFLKQIDETSNKVFKKK